MAPNAKRAIDPPIKVISPKNIAKKAVNLPPDRLEWEQNIVIIIWTKIIIAYTFTNVLAPFHLASPEFPKLDQIK